MKLRTRLNLIVTGLGAVFVGVLLGAELWTARVAINQEISASNIVASQVLGRLASVYSTQDGLARIETFLRELGHVRSNRIRLLSPTGEELYRAPPPTYKAGRWAPTWFARLLTPKLVAHRFSLPGGYRLVVAPNASRAVLDAWDVSVRLVFIGIFMVILMYWLAYRFIGRALRPFPVIVAGFARIQRGELGYRLPVLPGLEANRIGVAFNEMAQSVEDKVHAERKARDAELRLAERQELDLVVEQRLEEERRAIAHELHDEFSQSVTAIRSMALAVGVQIGDSHPDSRATTQLISDEAARLYDAMHGLIPRLTPLTLDSLDLDETLENLVRDWQQRYPAVLLSLSCRLFRELGNRARLAVYRVVQEGLINALRHGNPETIAVDVTQVDDTIHVSVTDDGAGLPENWARPGRFGLRGMRERIEGLGGRLEVSNRASHGTRLTAVIPLAAEPPDETDGSAWPDSEESVVGHSEPEEQA